VTAVNLVQTVLHVVLPVKVPHDKRSTSLKMTSTNPYFLKMPKFL
jgi:hypothetical protein